MEGPILQLGLKRSAEKRRYLFVCDDFVLLCKKLSFGNFMPKWFISLNGRKRVEVSYLLSVETNVHIEEVIWEQKGFPYM